MILNHENEKRYDGKNALPQNESTSGELIDLEKFQQSASKSNSVSAVEALHSAAGEVSESGIAGVKSNEEHAPSLRKNPRRARRQGFYEMGSRKSSKQPQCGMRGISTGFCDYDSDDKDDETLDLTDLTDFTDLTDQSDHGRNKKNKEKKKKKERGSRKSCRTSVKLEKDQEVQTEKEERLNFKLRKRTPSTNKSSEFFFEPNGSSTLDSNSGDEEAENDLLAAIKRSKSVDDIDIPLKPRISCPTLMNDSFSERPSNKISVNDDPMSISMRDFSKQVFPFKTRRNNSRKIVVGGSCRSLGTQNSNSSFSSITSNIDKNEIDTSLRGVKKGHLLQHHRNTDTNNKNTNNNFSSSNSKPIPASHRNKSNHYSTIFSSIVASTRKNQKEFASYVNSTKELRRKSDNSNPIESNNYKYHEGSKKTSSNGITNDNIISSCAFMKKPKRFPVQVCNTSKAPTIK